MIYLGACMVDVLGRHASKRNVTKHTQTSPQLGCRTYLAGGGSHSDNVYAFMQRKIVISLPHSYFINTSSSF